MSTATCSTAWKVVNPLGFSIFLHKCVVNVIIKKPIKQMKQIWYTYLNNESLKWFNITYLWEVKVCEPLISVSGVTLLVQQNLQLNVSCWSVLYIHSEVLPISAQNNSSLFTSDPSNNVSVRSRSALWLFYLFAKIHFFLLYSFFGRTYELRAVVLIHVLTFNLRVHL